MDKEMLQFDCLFGHYAGDGIRQQVLQGFWRQYVAWILDQEQVLALGLDFFWYKHLCKILVVTCNFDLELDWI